MAVVTYQCSKCQRTINLIQNKDGLDWIGNCNITLGCRGALQQQKVHQDYIRGQLPPDVIGLNNWVQRQILYNFVQTVERQTWVITHDLGTVPSVQVFVNVPLVGDPLNQQEVLPIDIVYNTDDQLTLTLPKAYAGIAQLIGRASNPDLLNPRPRPAPVTTVPTIQLTNTGELTIATRIGTLGSAAQMAVAMEYVSSSGVVTDINYNATNVPSSTSPWADVTRVIFKGKIYTVRTFNVQTVSGAIANGSSAALATINPNGPITLSIGSLDLVNNAFVIAGDYSLYFLTGSIFQVIGSSTIINDRAWIVTRSSYDPVTHNTSVFPTDVIPNTFSLPASLVQPGARQIVADEVIILLGSSPFTIFDKIQDSYIDITAVDSTATQFDIFYNAGDLFAATSIEETIYPPIRSV